MKAGIQGLPPGLLPTLIICGDKVASSVYHPLPSIKGTITTYHTTDASMARRVWVIFITRPGHGEVRTFRSRITVVEICLVACVEVGLIPLTRQAIISRAAVLGQMKREVDEGTILDAAICSRTVAAKPGVRVEHCDVWPVGLVCKLIPVWLGTGIVALLLKVALVHCHEISMPGQESSLTCLCQPKT